MKLRELFKGNGIDNREFKQGQIFLAVDSEVKIPDEKFTGRTLHEERAVVILYNTSDNSNPLALTVLAAPLSSQTQYKREVDLLLYEEDGVKRESLLRLGLTQPFCKIDLKGPVGTLTEEAIDRMIALQLHLMGVSLEEADEEEQKECSDDDYDFSDLPF